MAMGVEQGTSPGGPKKGSSNQPVSDTGKKQAATGKAPLSPGQVASKLPYDPVGAVLHPVAVHDNMAADEAALQRLQDLVAKNQHRASLEYLRRSDPDYDPEAQQRRAAEHGAPDVRNHYGDTNTELLLNAIGYTGNGMEDFNAAVERVNIVFNDVYGHPPTPAAVLDLLRSPSAQDANSLKSLLRGEPADSSAPQLDQGGYRQALNAALALSFSTGHDILTPAVEKIGQEKTGASAVDIINQEVPGVKGQQVGIISQNAVQVASVMPLTSDQAAGLVGLKTWLSNIGRSGVVNEQNTYEQNMRLIESAAPGAGDNPLSKDHTKQVDSIELAANALEATQQFQRKMIDTFNLTGLHANGIIDSKWSGVISRMQSNQAYQKITVSQKASTAGFGMGFDPYNAVDTANGNWKDNEDGRRAQEAIQQWTGALVRRQVAIKDEPLERRVIENMPLQAFDQSGAGHHIGSQALGAVDYVLGGSDHALSDKFTGSFLDSAWNVVSDTPAIAEHGIIRGVSTAFGVGNGMWQQSKTDIYALGAFGGVADILNGGWEADKKEAARRLEKENPTWLNIALNRPDAEKALSTYMAKLGIDKKTAEGASRWSDFISDVALDIVVTKKLGDLSRAADVGRFGSAMRRGDGMLSMAAFDTDARIQDDVHDALKALKDNRTGDAASLLRSSMAPEVLGERNFVLDLKTGEHRYDPLDGPVGQGRTPKEAPAPVEPPAEGGAATPEPTLEESFVSRWAKKFQLGREQSPGARSPLSADDPAVAEEASRRSFIEMYQAGDLTDEQAIAHLRMEAVQRQRLFQAWYADPHVPYKGRRPLSSPFSWAKARVWEATSRMMDKADIGFQESNLLGGGWVRNLTRTMREEFTKAGNWHELPVADMDPKNIYRLAHKAGLPVKNARSLEKRFIMARANKQYAELMAIRDELGAAAIAQGREATKGGIEKIFGVIGDPETGEIRANIQRDAVENLMATAKTDEERALYEDLLQHAKGETSPALPEEIMQNFSVPELGLRRKSTGIMYPLNTLNDNLLAIGAWNRRAILVTDPILFFKHMTADTGRRLIGAGLKPWTMGAGDRKVLADYLTSDAEAAGRYNRRLNLYRKGELRFDTEMKRGGGRGPSEMFWTKGASDQHLLTAAAYIDRRVMSGAYKAWKEEGVAGVERFYETDKMGRHLVEQEFPHFADGAEQQAAASRVMARMVDDNLTNITEADPNFLADAERVRNDLLRKNADVRVGLAKWMKKEDRNVPVSGHVSPGSEGFMGWADRKSMDIIGGYLTFNKWNRGGLYRDMTAHYFSNFVKNGMEKDAALEAASGIAGRISRYHMLDLADALQVEQTFRWAAYFFTKHRLYWTWLAQTMVARPELAVALHHVKESLDAHGNDGKITFHMPNWVPGLSPAGGRVPYTIPVARLFWLLENQGNPGALAAGAHEILHGHVTNAIPFTPGAKTELTTVDSGLKAAWLMVDLKLGRIHSSDAVEEYLNPSDLYRFRSVYARMQYSHMIAHNGEPMSDADATAKSVQHLFITTMWRGSGFTGGYIEDPTKTPEQMKVWKAYNDTLDPVKREELRKANPWIESMLGVYYSTAKQHTMGVQLWRRMNDAFTTHERRQDNLLQEFKSTGNPKALFGKRWNDEAANLTKELAQIKRDAKAAGATDWLAQANNDPFIDLHTTFAASLHDLYPGIDAATVAKVTKEAHPKWVDQYRVALNTTLSDAAINDLKPNLRGDAYALRAFYRQQLVDYNADPSSDAGKLRRSYFESQYAPYKDKMGEFFDKIDSVPSAQQGLVFDHILEWKIKQDHDRKVGGYTFPSPERLSYLLYPKEYRYSQNARNAYKDWGWLTPFEKERLGVKVDRATATGWVAYNNTLDTLYKKSAQKDGTPDYIPDEDKLKLARAIDRKHPGFLKDYIYGLQPAYVRLSQQKVLGETPQAQKAWQHWFGHVQQVASDLTGGFRAPHDATHLLEWNSLFRKTIFSTIMFTGLPGVDGGRPAAGKTGWLYRQAMKSPSQDFRTEFKNMVAGDPEFIYKVFQVGG